MALRLVEEVRRAPADTALRAEAILRSRPDDPEVRVVAEFALGLALRELGRLTRARGRLESAATAAKLAGLDLRRGQILTSLALALAYSGETRAALRATSEAEKLLHGGLAARNRLQRGLILQRVGRYTPALAEYRLALPELVRAGDELGQLQLRLNRSVIRGHSGDTASGTGDLERALELAERLDQTLLIASCRHNLGFLTGRAGDIPTALAHFAAAEETYRIADPAGTWAPVLEVDRAELLLATGLFAEARRRVTAALGALDAGENVTDAAEARVLAARVALAAGDPAGSVEHAAAAAAAFAHQRRPAWRLVSLAALVAARAALLNQDTGGRASSFSEADRTSLRRLSVKTAAQLERAGRKRDALQTWVVAGQLALEAGDLAAGRRLLGRATRSRRTDPAQVRLQTWLARALLREATGDEPGARRAISSGLSVLRTYRSSFGSAELRAHAGAQGLELARIAVRMAIRDDDPWRVLSTIDTLRFSTRARIDARPPDDVDLAHALAELRRIDAQLREAEHDPAAATSLLRLRGRLENTIRDRSRTALSIGPAAHPPGRVRRRALVEALGPAALVCYFAFEGGMRAVVVTSAGVRLVSLGTVAELVPLVDSVVASLHRLASGHASAAALAAARSALSVDGERLGATLVGPLELGARPLVIAPTGALHALPWHVLPELRTTSLVVAPSVSGWLLAHCSPEVHGATTLIAGPGLVAAEREVTALAPIYPEATTLTGSRATVEAALQALDGARTAHLATHGTFRADNPLFSSLRLADGPLTVYDLDRLRQPPSTVVLSACDGGRSGVTGGDELLGLAATLIRMGSRSLIAPLVPISDEASLPFAVDLHRRLAAGAEAPDALAAARASGGEEDGTLAARAAFVALGA